MILHFLQNPFELGVLSSLCVGEFVFECKLTLGEFTITNLMTQTFPLEKRLRAAEGIAVPMIEGIAVAMIEGTSWMKISAQFLQPCKFICRVHFSSALWPSY